MVMFSSYWKAMCEGTRSEADAFYFVCLKMCPPLRLFCLHLYAQDSIGVWLVTAMLVCTRSMMHMVLRDRFFTAILYK